MNFIQFLDYLIIRDKQGNEYPINKDEVLKKI